MLVEVHRQFVTTRHQVAGLRTLRTQLGRRLVDADHLPRQRVERLAVKFDPVPQLSNLARSSTARGRAQGLQKRQHTTGDARGAQDEHTQAHKRRHTCRKLTSILVCPPWPATRSTNRLPIASCVTPKSFECNISMQMSSTENAGKENRGLTLILARSGSPAAPMCGIGTSSLPRWLEVPVEAQCAPQSRLLATSSSMCPWTYATEASRAKRRGAPKPASCDHES